MDQNSLGSYRSDISNLSKDEKLNASVKKKAADNTDFQRSMYHQELNTLKIEKLSHRITIISVILPCIIIAILAFAYIDMKERVVDVDESQGSHVDQIARSLEEKLNALDVRIAKATFDLDEKLALIEKKSQDLEHQAVKISSTKADLNSVEAALDQLKQQIFANTGANKSAMDAVKAADTRFAADIKKIHANAATVQSDINSLKTDLKNNNDSFQSVSKKIRDDIQLFKAEFDARLLELSAYDQDIASLTKTTGLLDKKIKTLKQDIELSLTRTLDQKLASQQQAFDNTVKALKTELKAKPAPPAAVKPVVQQAGPSPVITAPVTPAPQVSNQDTGILEQTLTQ